jgi:hypothetical protein
MRSFQTEVTTGLFFDMYVRYGPDTDAPNRKLSLSSSLLTEGVSRERKAGEESSGNKYTSQSEKPATSRQ